MSRLTELKQVTEATSYTEVVKEALRLYEDVIKRSESGEKFYTKRDDTLSEYPIFGA